MQTKIDLENKIDFQKIAIKPKSSVLPRGLPLNLTYCILSHIFHQDLCSFYVLQIPNLLSAFLNNPSLKLLWLSEYKNAGSPKFSMNDLRK